MEFISEFKIKIKNSGFLIFSILIFIYFAYFTINGERGLLKYVYLKKEVAETQKIAVQYNDKKTKLEDKVRLLSPASLDLDLLEEQARIMLNLAGQDEFIILDKAND